MIGMIEVLEANTNREPEGTRQLAVAIILRLAEDFAELVIEAFNRRVARVEGAEVPADAAPAAVAAGVDLRVPVGNSTLVKDVQNLGLEEDLGRTCSETRTQSRVKTVVSGAPSENHPSLDTVR